MTTRNIASLGAQIRLVHGHRPIYGTSCVEYFHGHNGRVLGRLGGLGGAGATVVRWHPEDDR